LDNLFKYATSELSNDAFLCWLFSISKEKYSESNAIVYNISQAYLRKFCNYMGKIYVYDNGIKKQENDIDVLIKGKYSNGEEFIIAIENKTASDEHSDQLRKYREYVNRNYRHIKKSNRHFVYYKTSIQGDTKKIKEEGYTVFQICDIYSLLEEGEAGKSNNQLIADYYHFIKEEVESYEYYEKANIGDWDKNAFLGFFYYMSGLLARYKTVTINGFGYINNHNGGKCSLWFGNYKKVTNKNRRKIGFHLSLETPNTNKNEKWVCRLIIRANEHDKGFKWTKADIKQFFGTIDDIGGVRRQPGKFMVLAQLFQISDVDSKKDYEYLENMVIENLKMYKKWQAKEGFKL
jgi:hypothetical protein